MSSRNPFRSILRIILDEFLPQVRGFPIELLKQVAHPIFDLQSKREEPPRDLASQTAFVLDNKPNEREFYVLAAVMVLVTGALLRARQGDRVGDIFETLGPDATQIMESLHLQLKEVQESTFGGEDLLGRVLQGLLDPLNRKLLAAFHTKPVVAKFVVQLLIKEGRGQFIDPACGTGAMLIAAYYRFQELDESTDPRAILAKLRGNEVNAITRWCAETNLRLDAGSPPVTPVNLSQSDVFHLDVNPSSKVDFLGTNPPFTRGERLSSTYKNYLRDFFSHQAIFAGDAKLLFCSKNMPLHGYFLLDMDRFLRPGGRFGVVIPASTLHLAGLRGVRKYLLAHYALEYVITSDVEPFSEDTDLKEVILVGRLRGEQQSGEVETTFVTIFTSLTRQNYAELLKAIEHPEEIKQAQKTIRIQRVSLKALGEGIADWSAFFPPEENIKLNEILWSTGKIGRIRDLEHDLIEAFRGFRQDFAKYWAVPNQSWRLTESKPNQIKVQNVDDPQSQIILPASSWHRGLSRPEFYPRPLIQIGDSYILKETRTSKSEEGMGRYLAWMREEFKEDKAKYEKFIRQLRQVGTRFNFAGRIAFCHRIDVTTSKVVCYLTQDAVQLNQNWFSIRGLSPVAEEFLVAWFNSTLFMASYILRRRIQRGPYGQTAVREFKEYLIPLLDKLDAGQIQQVIDQFHEFNQSHEFDFPVSEQFSRCLSQKTARKEFDLAVLEAIQVFPSQRQKQNQFLEQIYSILVAMIDKIRQQGKRFTSNRFK